MPKGTGNTSSGHAQGGSHGHSGGGGAQHQGGGSHGGGHRAMTASDASRIQSSQAKTNGDMLFSGFAARAQRAAARNSK
ncbi:hypothetical protein BCR44DRAFT_36705, partial [Catenaria anguillulae PL171]